MLKVFLSASVPLPDRDPRFMATADVISIREAVKALIGEIIPSGEIVFGGHPAITPLVALLLRGLGESARKRVTLYQSAYFTERFPQENDEFLKVTIVPDVDNSRDQSLAAMRRRMLEDINFDVGVFIV
jgi:SLOG cluster3 family